MKNEEKELIIQAVVFSSCLLIGAIPFLLSGVVVAFLWMLVGWADTLDNPGLLVGSFTIGYISLAVTCVMCINRSEKVTDRLYDLWKNQGEY